MNFFSLVWKNLLRSKRRTLLTIGSSAVLVLLLAVILAMYETMNEPPSGDGPARRLMVIHSTSLAYNLPQSYGPKIREIPGVKAVTLMSWFGGEYGEDPRDSKFGFGRLAAETETFFDTQVEIEISPEHKKAYLEDRQGAIAGKRLVEKQGWKLGDKIVFRGDYYPCNPELYLRGIFTSKEDIRVEDNLWFQFKYLDELLNRSGKTGTVSVLCATTADVPRVAQAIDARFKDSDAPTRAMTEKEFSLSFMEMIGNLKVIIFSISFAILFVMALVTANTIAMGTRERVTETAVMKTLGFVRGHIVALVLSEALVISVVGGGLGLLISHMFLQAIGQVGFIAGLGLGPLSIGVAASASLLVGIASAGVPAFHLASTRIVDGLRRVG